MARMRAVAALKAEHPIALADCFAIATAAAKGATLITRDPEIIGRTDEIPCAVRDARQPISGAVARGRGSHPVRGGGLRR